MSEAKLNDAMDRIAELEAELATWRQLAENGAAGLVSVTKRLTESQAREAKLREALNTVTLVVGLTAIKYAGQLAVLQEAVTSARALLAIPQDRSALDAALAEARRKWMLEAAEICSKIEDENYALFKGRDPHANHPQRADTYINGMSDGAGTCAEAIRQAAERKK